MNCASGTPTAKSTPASFIPWTISLAFSSFIPERPPLNRWCRSAARQLIEERGEVAVLAPPSEHRNDVHVRVRLDRPLDVLPRRPTPLLVHHDLARLFRQMIILEQRRGVGMRRVGGVADDRGRAHDRGIGKNEIDRRALGL